MEILENNYNAVKEWLENQTDDELMYIHNEYCDFANYPDDTIYNNDEEFFSMFFSKTDDALRAAFYGAYNYPDRYVQFNGLGNLDSADHATDFIDLEELTDYVYNNPKKFNIELEETEEDD